MDSWPGMDLRGRMCSGVGESVPCVWSGGESTAVQHHKGRRAVGVLCCSYRAARLQAQTLQDQDAGLVAHRWMTLPDGSDDIVCSGMQVDAVTR